jgi:urea transport system permease protein
MVAVLARRGRRPLVVILMIVALALLTAVPVLNMLPPTSPFYLSDFTVVLVGKYLCYAMLALSIDLIWGYCGVLSLGHGAFFALGGYVMGMHLMRSIGTRGVYQHPTLPDFMVFLNWKELPWYWYGFDNFAFAAVMIVLVPGVLALAFGWLAFRSRITGVYFSIITQALTFALMLAFFRNDMGFGGNNGMTDFKDLLGFPLNQGSTRRGLYVASLIALVGTYLICWRVTNSKLGRVLIAIRDASSRVRFLGYSVTAYQLFVFTLSAMLAGVAGALYTPQVGIINPGEYSPANSIEAVIWVAVGGRGSLYGAVVGAFAVNGAKTWLTSSIPEVWLFVLGGLFIAVTLLLPRGLVGLIGLGAATPRGAAGGLARLLPGFAVAKPRRSDG